MTLEMFAVVELMGHQQIAGKVSEQVIAGAGLLRVDVPETTHGAAFTKFYGTSAIYAITPCDEAVARRVAENLSQPPIQPYLMREQSPLLTEKVEPRKFDDQHPDWDEYAEDDYGG